MKSRSIIRTHVQFQKPGRTTLVILLTLVLLANAAGLQTNAGETTSSDRIAAVPDARSDRSVPDTMLAPPANDNFASAQTLTGLTGMINATNVDATKQAGEQNHAFNRGGSSIWFKYVAPGNGVMTVRTGGTQFDTLMAAYSGSSLNNLQLIAANDNLEFSSVGDITSQVVFGTVTGVTYFIAVDGKFGSGGPQEGAILLSFQLDNVLTSDTFDTGTNSFSLATTSRTRQVTASNVGASKEVGEPNHAGNAGGKSIWFSWRNAENYPRTIAFDIQSRSLANPAAGLHFLFAFYTGTGVGNLTPVIARQFLNRGRLIINAPPQANYVFALDGFDGGQGAETGNFTLTYGVSKGESVPDLDGDGRADLSVFRPITGTWFSLESVAENLRSLQFGANGDRPNFSDFDQDDRPDHAVFRPDTGIWYLNNSTGGFQAFNWGTSGDIPLVRTALTQGSPNYFPTVFRPASGVWYIYVGAVFFSVQFGQNGDIPFSADFSGDGTDEYAVFRPSNSTWYILDAAIGQFQALAFGASGDKPVPADYDGDGRTDVAVFRPSNGAWYWIDSSTNSFKAVTWGLNVDRPQPADYDNDGKADHAVYRNGVWHILSSINASVRTVSFGLASDVPVTSPVR